MDFWSVIERRRSVRAYSGKTDVPKDAIDQVLHAALLAPSAGNRQPWRFVVVRDPRLRKALADAAYGQEFVAEAPVVIVVCAEPQRSASRYGRRGAELYCLQDTAAATEHILLAATALGFGTCWVGAFDESRAAESLQLPGQFRPVALIPLGKPASDGPRETSRRPFEEVVEYRD